MTQKRPKSIYLWFQLLQSVDKLGVLAVCKVQPFLVLQFHIGRRSADGRSLFVLVIAVPVDEDDVDDAEGPAYDLWKVKVSESGGQKRGVDSTGFLQ